jgi:hypothetical protein
MAQRSEQPPEQTYDGSKRVIVERLPDIRAKVGNAGARAVLTQALVEEILEVAWSHRLDRDPDERRREIRQLVSDAVETQTLADG